MSILANNNTTSYLSLIIPKSSHIHHYASGFVLLNGIYDVTCALSILGILPIFNRDLQHIHLNMLTDKVRIDKGRKNPKSNNSPEIFERFFAYWVFTYGSIRLFSPWNSQIVSASYLIEMLFFSLEWNYFKDPPFFGVFCRVHTCATFCGPYSSKK